MSGENCACGGNPALIYTCSGAADVGELADRSARQLSRDDKCAMSCLAGIGGNISGFIKSTEGADKILVIDGCPLACARKTLEEKGLTNFKHIMITELGFKKGQTEVNQENIAMICEKAVDLLGFCKSL
ncbi:MAG: putative zinc-binding protein [Candidatus Riflebacteria bacterium]|nr:putative zinc-binding protein [Candidatus Riflebacteria bacterium]